MKQFDEETLKYAADRAKAEFEWPPSIAEFVAICKSRRGRYEDHNDVLARLDAPREYVPPSPLLAEYMAKHPEPDAAKIQNAKEWLEFIKAKLKSKEGDRSDSRPTRVNSTVPAEYQSIVPSRSGSVLDDQDREGMEGSSSQDNSRETVPPF